MNRLENFNGKNQIFRINYLFYYLAIYRRKIYIFIILNIALRFL